MIQEIVDSIFNPGINNSVRIFTCVVFLLLIVVLFGMIFLTNFNIHVIIMFILANGVFVSLVWFMYELEQAKKADNQDENKNDNQGKGKVEIEETKKESWREVLLLLSSISVADK